MSKELLTHSRQAAFKSCRKKHYYSYELGLRRIEEARALRMGSAFHAGIEQLGHGKGVRAACEAVRAYYTHCPDHFNAYDWAIECETILRLVCAYEWRWNGAAIQYVKTEFAFQLPMINPETGKSTPIFDLAGKIDGIVRLEDGRLAVKETKTMSEDIGPDSAVWRRLRMDLQISLYIHAARRMGFAVDTVLYDVVRKPAIAPTPVPLLDDDGLKIVRDAAGERVRNTTGKKEWRQTGDNDKGYILQTRPMRVEEWGAKLTDDIVSRPDFYFARVEIPRMDQDIEEAQAELWDVQQAIREAQRSGRWYRTVDRNTCPYCSYFNICSTNQQVQANSPPLGFEFVADVHPELEVVNDNGNIATESATGDSATEADAEVVSV